MTQSFTKILFGIFATLLLALFSFLLFFSFSTPKQQVTLLNMNNVMVSSSQTVSFLFDTDADSELRLYVEEIGTSGRRNRMSDVNMILTDRSNPSNYRLISESDLGKGIRVDKSLYELRITGDRRLRGEVLLKIRITQTPGKELTRGAATELVRINNFYIQPGDPEGLNNAVRNAGSGRSAGSNIILPTMNISVEKGEEIILRTDNDGLEVEVFQLARSFQLQKNTPLVLPPAERDGMYDLVFFFTKSDDRSGLGRIFSRDVSGSSFNMTVSSKPEKVLTEQEKAAQARGSESRTAPTPGSFQIPSETSAAKEKDDGDDVARMLQASQEAAQESQRELVSALQQLTRVDTSETSQPLFGDQIRLRLPPARNLFERPRACEEIRLGDAEFWTYLIGAGEESLKQFDERDQRIRDNSRGNFRTLLEYYADEILDNLNVKKDLALLRFDQNRVESFGYAIVDDVHKDAFMRGESFRDIHGNHYASPNAHLVGFDYGNSEIDRGTRLYVCACNPNGNIPLEVHLRFESFRKIAITTR